MKTDDRTAHALQEYGDGFRQFARNGRWGACVGCPRDSDGNAYPEFCEYTDRYDHKLSAAGLAETFEHCRNSYGR